MNEQPGGTPSRSAMRQMAAWVLVGAFVIQAAAGAARDSVTVDEFAHVAIGVYMVRQLDFRSDPLNAPLARLLLGAPLAVDPSVQEPRYIDNFWGMGLQFMSDHLERYASLVARSRWVVIGIAALLALLLARWAEELFGPNARLAVLFLVAFSPSLLAHGHLATTDLMGAFGFCAALYQTWRFLGRPTLSQAAVLGGALAAAILLKLSSALLVPLVGAIVLGRSLRRGRQDSRWTTTRATRALAVAGLVMVLGLNLGYGFAGSFRRFDQLELPPHTKLADVASVVPWLRLPLPETLLLGLEAAPRGDDPQDNQFYLAGQISSQPWWYYHLVAYSLKTPLPLLLLGVVAFGAYAARRFPGRDTHCLFLGIGCMFGANALLNSLNLGVRHVLAVEPLLILAAAPIVAGAIERGASSRGHRALGASVTLLLAWYAVGTIRVAPAYLEYFNEAAGGPENGHRWLLDSNLDWGQDLVRLADFMRDRGLSTVHLAYFGSVHPWVYGIHFTPITPESRGTVVISPMALLGMRLKTWVSEDRYAVVPQHSYDGLLALEPVGRLGAMFVFELPAKRE